MRLTVKNRFAVLLIALAPTGLTLAQTTAEQARLRENMKTVAQSSQYYERLLAKLNEQESSIERLQKERDDLTAKRESMRRELSEYLDSLNVG
jgi:predicted transcriptional regulator